MAPFQHVLAGVCVLCVWINDHRHKKCHRLVFYTNTFWFCDDVRLRVEAWLLLSSVSPTIPLSLHHPSLLFTRATSLMIAQRPWVCHASFTRGSGEAAIESRGERERKKFSVPAGRKAERSNSAIQKERMRTRRGADRGGDTKRRACAAKAAWREKVRISWRGTGGPFY